MENTQTNEKYYRQNGAEVQGAADITSVRRQQLKDSIRNNRLGTYNAHGRYTLAPKVTNEILAINKYVYKKHFDEVMRESKDVLEIKATSSIPVFGQIEFRIVFKEKFAKLYLIENVYREFNGYQEIYGEQITEINCEDDRDDVVDYVMALLNVSILDEADDGKIPEEDPEKVKAILFNKLYLSMVSKNFLKDSSFDERDAFEDMVAQLKDEGGEYGKRVLRGFIDRIEKRPDIMQLKDEDGYNEALNDALVGAMEVATTEDDLKDPNIKRIYDDIYRRRYKNVDDDLRKAQEDVKDKDLKRVADGVLGKQTSDKIFGDPEELDSLIRGKREETAQEPQDNSWFDEFRRNPILKQVIDKATGKKEDKDPHEDFDNEARRKEEERAKASDHAQGDDSGQGGEQKTGEQKTGDQKAGDKKAGSSKKKGGPYEGYEQSKGGYWGKHDGGKDDNVKGGKGGKTKTEETKNTGIVKTRTYDETPDLVDQGAGKIRRSIRPQRPQNVDRYAEKFESLVLDVQPKVTKDKTTINREGSIVTELERTTNFVQEQGAVLTGDKATEVSKNQDQLVIEEEPVEANENPEDYGIDPSIKEKYNKVMAELKGVMENANPQEVNLNETVINPIEAEGPTEEIKKNPVTETPSIPEAEKPTVVEEEEFLPH